MNPESSTQARFDVITVAHYNHEVHGLVACHVNHEEAKATKERLRENLSRIYFMAVVPTGSSPKGSVFDKPVPQKKPRQRGNTFLRRQADLVCVVCESPNLETRIHCALHAEHHNRRTGVYKTHARMAAAENIDLHRELDQTKKKIKGNLRDIAAIDTVLGHFESTP